MKAEFFSLPSGVPAVLYGASERCVWLYLHGRYGQKEEAERFAALVRPRGEAVLAIDLPEHGARREGPERLVPWQVVPELRQLLRYARSRWPEIRLRAVSLGVFFALLAFGEERLSRALFSSPVPDLESLILAQMQRAGVDEAALRAAGEIETGGEVLSWRYLTYVREHPVTRWDTPTALLYPAGDELVPRETVERFARRFGCALSVTEGAHWLHTPEQLAAQEAFERRYSLLPGAGGEKNVLRS